MLSFPDFKEKQVLFVFSKYAKDDKLQFKNGNICYTSDGDIINQLSCHKVLALFIIGDFSLTTVLVQNCLQYGVSLFLLKQNFSMIAGIPALADGNYLLRQKQYLSPDGFTISKHLVMNKIRNQQLLLHAKNKTSSYMEYLHGIRSKIDSLSDFKALLGIEGSSTKQFFSDYFEELGWYRRMPRTKVDHINILMDIGYTFLFNFVDSLLSLHGFDTYKGVYHTPFYQRKSLVCDIIEPFRCIIDKQILKSFHLKQIDTADFKESHGRYLLEYQKQQKYLKLFTEALMDYKEDIFHYVRSYYYCIMNDKIDYPVFHIS